MIKEKRFLIISIDDVENSDEENSDEEILIKIMVRWWQGINSFWRR